jgi:ribonuclease HI
MFSNKKTSPKIYPEVEMTEYKLQFDGCSKGNPGTAGAGSVIYKNGEEIWSGSTYVGNLCTNNEAEYQGLILGMRAAIEQLNISHIIVEGDSMLVIKQMKGEFKVKSQNLQVLHRIAKQLSHRFDHITFQHVYRDNNKRADELSNLAIVDYQSKTITT